MAHWKGHTDHHIKEMEALRLATEEVIYEASLSRWFKMRRDSARYIKRNILYYIAGVSFMRGIEPLMFNIPITDLMYKHAFVSNMVLITMAAGLAAVNLIFNAKERR